MPFLPRGIKWKGHICWKSRELPNSSPLPPAEQDQWGESRGVRQMLRMMWPSCAATVGFLRSHPAPGKPGFPFTGPEPAEVKNSDTRNRDDREQVAEWIRLWSPLSPPIHQSDSLEVWVRWQRPEGLNCMSYHKKRPSTWKHEAYG